MGKYINGIGHTFVEKVKALTEKHNATPTIPEFQPNLVCVVDNGYFAAAAWCYSEREFAEFNADDGRRKLWLVVPGAEYLATD